VHLVIDLAPDSLDLTFQRVIPTITTRFLNSQSKSARRLFTV